MSPFSAQEALVDGGALFCVMSSLFAPEATFTSKWDGVEGAHEVLDGLMVGQLIPLVQLSEFPYDI